MLNHKFRFYVPGTNGGVIIDRALQSRMADKVMGDMADLFGGCTVTEARGAWKDKTGKLVKEPVVLVESFTDEAGANWHTDDVFALAEEVCGIMGQESIALEVNDILHLISAKKVESVVNAEAA